MGVGRRRPEFLLVHGLASNARLWDGVAAVCIGGAHGVRSVDLRGQGLSAKPKDGFEFETMASDLAGLIEQRMSPPVIAAGQSFGGNLVLELAARHPELVSGVVCVDGGFVDLQSAWPDWNDALQLLTPPPLDHLHGERLSTDAAAVFPGWPEEGVNAQLANLEIQTDGRVTRRLALDSHLQNPAIDVGTIANPGGCDRQSSQCSCSRPTTTPPLTTARSEGLWPHSRTASCAG